MLSNPLILCCSLLLLLSVFTSIRVFSNESALHIRWPKDWSFSFSMSPFNDYSGLISFRIDWFDLLAVQGILKSLLQHHNSKASILLHSAGDIRNMGSTPGLGRYPGGGNSYPLQYYWAFLVAQLVENPPATWETWVLFLGCKDP